MDDQVDSSNPSAAPPDLAAVAGLVRAIDRLIAAVVVTLMGWSRQQVIAEAGLTTESWLRAVAGRTGADAGMLIVAAERLAEMPATLAAFCGGVMSWATVRGIVSAVRTLTGDQRRWLDETLAADAERLARLDGDAVTAIAERLVERARPDLQRERAQRAVAAQRLQFQPAMDGTGTAFAAMDPETFTAVQTAIETLTHDAAGRRVASNIDALRALARQRLTRTGATSAPAAAGEAASDVVPAGAAPNAEADSATDAAQASPGGAPSAARPEMIIVTDVSLLADLDMALEHRCGDLAALEQVRGAARVLWRRDRPAPALTPQAVQRLACDATLRPVLVDGAEVLGTAEPYARVSASLRAALVARDAGCRFPACHRPVDVCDAHHIVPRAQDGPTTLHNLALLCDAHHHAVHEGGWAATLHPDATISFSRRGVTLTSEARCGQVPRMHGPPPPGRPTRRRDTSETSDSAARDDRQRSPVPAGLPF